MIREMFFIVFKCLFCTIIIELLMAFLLGIKNKKDIINIILINIVTNPIVSTIPFYINMFYGLKERNIALFILEILTVIVEGYVYKKYLLNKKKNPFLLSLVLNASSYFIGRIIWEIIFYFS